MDRYLAFENSNVFPTSASGEVAVDWLEDDNAHIFQFDLPGLRREQVEVQILNDNILQISGSRNAQEKLYGKWHVKERASGSFRRVFQLPGEVKGDEVKAYDMDGVLVVKVPKKKRLIRKIPVALL